MTIGYYSILRSSSIPLYCFCGHLRIQLFTHFFTVFEAYQYGIVGILLCININRIHYTVYIHTVELFAAILVMVRAFLSYLSSLSYYRVYMIISYY